ncbi:MAG: type II secretion system protein [Armatimonadota bacterium]
MSKVRGATIIEMIFTMSLMVAVIGSTVTLYAFVAIRAGDSVTKYNTYQQTKDLMLAISDVTSNAMSCSNVTIGSVTALKCKMPNDGTDRDGDGIIDQYKPSGINKLLKETYTAGKRIWFIPSTKPFSLGTTGKYWYRAMRTDDSNIVIGDIDANWSYLTGSTPKIYIPGTVTFSHNASNLSTNVQIAIDTSINPNSAVQGFSGNLGNKIPAITLSRRFFWRSAQ